MEIQKLHSHILDYVQGGFSEEDMKVMKEEIEKLEPSDVFVEIGTDEGRSARTAHEYAKKGVFKLWIDIHDVVPHEKSIGRAPWFEQEGMVGLGKTGFYIHGDADEFANFILRITGLAVPFVKLLFIDGHHDYKSVKRNTLLWEPYVLGTIIFHDYDHEDTKRWLDEHYGDSKEIVAGGKMVRVRK